ncbi:MAG: hypothetical protein Kow00108_13860 [Calditrichia bacterium]
MTAKINFNEVNYLSGALLSSHFQTYDELHLNHNLVLHGSGIIEGYREILAVEIEKKEFPWKLIIKPGALIDHSGNLIVIDHPLEIEVAQEIKDTPDACLYMYIYLLEQKINNNGSANLLTYSPACKCSYEPIEDKKYFEIGRVKIAGTNTVLKQAIDFTNPGLGEIDRRFVPLVQPHRINMNEHDKNMLIRGIEKRRYYLYLIESGKFSADNFNYFKDFRYALLSFQMNVMAGILNTLSIVKMIRFSANLEIEFLNSFRKEFRKDKYSKQLLSNIITELAELLKKINQSNISSFNLNEIITLYFNRVHHFYENLFKDFKKDLAYYAQSCDLFDDVILIQNDKYQLIDQIEFDNCLERKKQGLINFTKGVAPWEASRAYQYADDSNFDGIVVIFTDDFIELSLNNIRDNKELILFSATLPDHQKTDTYALMENSKKIKWVMPNEIRPSDKAINKVLIIPADQVTNNQLTIKCITEPGMELAISKIWVYQKI